jgi:hypothetical protein
MCCGRERQPQVEPYIRDYGQKSVGSSIERDAAVITCPEIYGQVADFTQAFFEGSTQITKYNADRSL